MATLQVLPPLLSGTLFGSALTASSVYLPSVIQGQLSLTSMLMLKTFLTASACSAIIVYLSNELGYVQLPIRKNTSYGWFSNYDANIVGGTLQGIGMALTGACPGTVLVQVALGITPSPAILLGGILGGLLFTITSDQFKRKSTPEPVKNHTVMQRLKVSNESAVLGYEAMLIGMILLVDKLGVKEGRFWLDPVQGGLLIGIAQAASVLVAKKTLGVSTAYSELAGQFTNILSGKGLNQNYSNILFAGGVMAGAKLTSQRIPLQQETGPAISAAAAVFGGMCSIYGARLAGGCTSGHGISGMSTLSLSSFVTVISMFGGGIAFMQLVKAF